MMPPIIRRCFFR